MGRVLEVRGFVVPIHVNEDGEGLHVHVFKSGRSYRVRLRAGNAELMDEQVVHRFRSEARRATIIVNEHLGECWEEWLQCHGRKPRF